MAITVNTNMAAINISNNLESATAKMNKASERMSSGKKINSAADDAAGFSVAKTLSNTISATKVAKDNVAIGQDLLSTTEGVLNVVQDNLTRIQDLVTEGSNGTYSSSDLTAIQTEIDSRFTEISSVTTNAKFNGQTLFSNKHVNIQAGTTAGEAVVLSSSIFSTVDVSANKTAIDGAFTGGGNVASALSATLAGLTTAINNITGRETNIGAFQNQLSSVSDALTTTDTNLKSARSTVQDSDTASDSADYVQQQILQEISTSLLSSANQAASIAYTLVRGI